MAKKKPINRKSIEMDFQKLFDHIGKQNFENMEEAQAFLDQLKGQSLDDIIPKKRGRLSKKEQSMELLYEAYDTTIGKGRKLVKKAIELDPDNADAYNYLANIERDLNKAADLYKKGMTAGMKEIGEKEFEEMKGYFWGFHETRPFMRAKAGYAECLLLTGQIEGCISQYLEMIELNPNDNQGVRYQLAALLVNQNKIKEYERLRKLFKEDASALWLFTYAIFLFKKEGNSKKAEKALLKAHEANNHVISFLIGEQELPDTMPDYYSWGNVNEAIIYLGEAGKLWMETPHSIEWAGEFYIKRKNIN